MGCGARQRGPQSAGPELAECRDHTPISGLNQLHENGGVGPAALLLRNFFFFREGVYVWFALLLSSKGRNTDVERSGKSGFLITMEVGHARQKFYSSDPASRCPVRFSSSTGGGHRRRQHVVGGPYEEFWQTFYMGAADFHRNFFQAALVFP